VLAFGFVQDVDAGWIDLDDRPHGRPHDTRTRRDGLPVGRGRDERGTGRRVRSRYRSAMSCRPACGVVRSLQDARGDGCIRHPGAGAARKPRFTYVNHHKSRDLSAAGFCRETSRLL
jgi:hypothetical protein